MANTKTTFFSIPLELRQEILLLATGIDRVEIPSLAGQKHNEPVRAIKE
jgi:hypothetical protein